MELKQPSSMKTKTKVCTFCGEEKSLHYFANDKKGKYGVKSQCRDCVKYKPTLLKDVKLAGFNFKPDPTIYERVEKILELEGLSVPESLHSILKKGHLLSYVCNNKQNRLAKHFRADNTEEELFILDAVICARRIVLEIFGVHLEIHHITPRIYRERFKDVDNVNSLYPLPKTLHGMCHTKILTPEMIQAQAREFLERGHRHPLVLPGEIPTWWKCVSGMDFVKLVGEAVSLKVGSNPM